jgi:hypothetical protein
MGARVLVTPGEVAAPVSITHPLLATMKVVPEPAIADEPKPDAPAAVKSDKAAAADPAIKPEEIAAATAELRSTVGHDVGAKPTINEAPAPTPLREQTHTADASGALPAAKDPVTMSDASPAGSNPPPHQDAAAETGKTAPPAQDAAPTPDSKASTDAKPEAAKAEAEPVEAKHDAAVPTGDKPAEVKPTEAAVGDAKPADVKSPEAGATENKTADADKKADEAQAAAPAASSDAAKTEPAKTEASAVGAAKADEPKAEVKADATTGEVKADEGKPDMAKAADVKAADVKAPEVKADEAKAADVKTDAPKADAAKLADTPAAKPEDSVATVGAPAGAPDVKAADVKKDQGRLPDVDKPAAPKAVAAKPAPKRTGQIAVFISRKDSKLYVRQNMAPLFDVPVVIAPSDRPLGTHVFTAEVDKDDANLLHWTVVSLPASRHAEQQEERHASRKRKVAAVVAEPKPTPVADSPAEALDRLTIPADVMARINEAISTGGSIVVSDQGIAAGETGEGTDFIVSLR